MRAAWFGAICRTVAAAALAAALQAPLPALAQNIGTTDCFSAVSLAARAAAHITNPNPSVPGPPLSQTTSATCHTTSTVSYPSGAAAAFPATAAALEALVANGLAEWSQAISVTTDLTIGPGTYLIGLDQAITYFHPLGTNSLNTHTHLENFVHLALGDGSTAGSALAGDLHTAPQNVLTDDGFSFIDRLLQQGSAASSVMFSTQPMAYAGGLANAALDSAENLAAVNVHALDLGAWVAATPRFSSYAGTTGHFGFTSGGVALSGGVDRDEGPWHYGFALSVDGTGIRQDSTGDSARIGTLRGGIYGGYDTGDWSLTGAVAAGLHGIDSTRLSTLPVPATARYGARTLSAGLEAAGRYELDEFLLKPMAGVVFTSVATDPFAETGTLAMTGSASSTEALKVYIGGEASTAVVGDNGWLWTPSLNGRLILDLLDDPRGYTGTFLSDPGQTPFLVTGLQPSRLAALVGGQLTAEIDPGFEAFAAYDVTIRGGALTHYAAAGARGRF
jgi:uncharacterized protein with beta-barrel porin domain